jgi:hypothetical protein
MTALSFTRLQNVRLLSEGAIAEWAIGDYLPGGGCATGEFTLVLGPHGAQVQCFSDGRQALAQFLDLPVMEEIDVPNVGAEFIHQSLAEHLERITI